MTRRPPIAIQVFAGIGAVCLVWLILFSSLTRPKQVWVWNALEAPVDVDLCGERTTVRRRWLGFLKSNCWRGWGKLVTRSKNGEILEQFKVHELTAKATFY